MSGFTKGLWCCEGTIVYGGEDVCAMLPDNGIATKRKLANAALISAAPELLEALLGMMHAFEARMADSENVEWHECWGKAVKAVAKASGEEP